MQFNNHCVNSIRLVSLVDDFGKVHFLKAALRCGVGDAIVDNLSQGGVAYPFNLDYGMIEGPGMAGSYSLTDKKFIYQHPGADILMVGYKIPFWKDVLDMVREATKLIPKVRFIGWDIAITPDGSALIEGNARPGQAVLEHIGQDRGFKKRIMGTY